MGNQGNTKARIIGFRHREADAVHSDGTFLHNVAKQFPGGLNPVHPCIAFRNNLLNRSHTFHVSLHDMPVQTVRGPQRFFQIHPVPRLQQMQGGPAHGFRHHVRRKGIAPKMHYR